MTKKVAKKVIYKAKTETDKSRFEDKLQRDDEKNEVFRIDKQILSKRLIQYTEV